MHGIPRWAGLPRSVPRLVRLGAPATDGGSGVYLRHKSDREETQMGVSGIVNRVGCLTMDRKKTLSVQLH